MKVTKGIVKHSLERLKLELDFLVLEVEIDNQDVSDSLIDAIARLHSEMVKYDR